MKNLEAQIYRGADPSTSTSIKFHHSDAPQNSHLPADKATLDHGDIRLYQNGFP